MTVKNAFYAQSGGVTAVINATACGLIQEARRHPDRIGKVFAGRDGIIGALTENLIDTSLESDEDIACLLYTSDAADERSSVDLGGRRIIKKKHANTHRTRSSYYHHNKQ